jgi:hypothetical protein
MNVLTDTLRGLVRRRLWPVALLLIAAGAAVPTVLTKHPVATPAPALPATASSAPSADSVFVSAAGDDQGDSGRHVIGSRKDPFAPAPLPKAKHHKTAKKSSATATATPTPAPAPAPAPATSGGGGSTTTPPVSTPPVAPAPAPARVVFPKDSLSVRFGTSSTARRTLQVRQTLPSNSNPVLVYMGLEDGGKTAVFMVGSDVTSLQGDGRCAPAGTTCDTLRLKAGDTEFVSVAGAQYELDLVKVHHTKKSRLGKAGTTTPTGVTARAGRRTPRPHVQF